MKRRILSRLRWNYGNEDEVYDYNWDGVQFAISGFREDVTIMELNKGATFDDGELTIADGLVPDVKQVIIVGLSTGTVVKINDKAYSLVLDKLFEL